MQTPSSPIQTPFQKVMAYSGGHAQGPFDLAYYVKGALAGNIHVQSLQF